MNFYCKESNCPIAKFLTNYEYPVAGTELGEKAGELADKLAKHPGTITFTCKKRVGMLFFKHPCLRQAQITQINTLDQD